jgi:hypothetical protein
MAECLKAGGGRHRPSKAREMASPRGDEETYFDDVPLAGEMRAA